MGLSPVLPYKLPELDQLIYVKTNIGGWFFDAFLNVDYNSTLRVTEHPIQTGADVTDHAYMEAEQLVFEIGMSDVAKSLVDGQFTQGWSRSVTAYQVLKELQRSRVPMQVKTRLQLYKNMIVENLRAKDDYTTLNGLKCVVTMREIFIAQVSTVTVSTRPQVTGSTKAGEAQAIIPNQSILKQIYTMASGGGQ